MIYLVHYDRSKGVLVSLLEFEDSRRDLAYKAKLDLEISLLGSNGSSEVVLLEAETEDDLRSTHSRYFQTLEQLRTQDRSR